MRIKFQRTGGFANIPVNVELDGDNMDQALSGQMKELVGKLLPFDQTKVEPAADVCTYNLTIEDNGQEQSLNTNDMHLTDDMQDLFDFLMQNFVR